MSRLNPEPVPQPWALRSFRYYNHSCKVMNVGGHKNVIELRDEYRHNARAIEDYWHAYMGVWWVYFDNKMVMITPTRQEAELKFEELKRQCILLRDGIKEGNALVEQHAKRIKDKPIQIDSSP